MTGRYALYAAATLLALVGLGSNARAALMTYDVSFSGEGSYGVGGTAAAPYEGGTAISGSFQITLDPALFYLTPTALNGFAVSLDDPHFTPSDITASFGSSFNFTYAYGVLDVRNYLTAPASLNGTDDFLLRFGNFTTGTPQDSLYYSQTGFDNTLTTGGTATVSAVPLPASLPLFATALLGLGTLGRRRIAALS